ncbi:ATP-binding protein [Desulfobacterales bacterium HSG16]|nr:ATP-binding protein [Desulfobacterales bacterium HSG16]
MSDHKDDTLKKAKKPIIVGNVVTGRDFFGREKEIAKFTGLLKSDANVLLLGQRRMGKTSLMRETANRFQDSAVCLYVDIEHCDSAQDVMLKLGKVAHEHRSLIGAAKDGFFDMLKSIRGSIDEIGTDALVKIKLREGAAENWSYIGDGILEWLAKTNKKVIILIDELPVFINRVIRNSSNVIVPEKKKDADIFLSWLRGASIQHVGKIAFATGGSIGIEPILEQIGLSDRLNNFTAFHLEPWSAEIALEFLEDRAEENGICFKEGAKEHILEKLGVAIPHFVQKFLLNISWDCMDRSSDACDVVDVDRIYKDKMLAVQGSIELATYVERLERTLGREKFLLARDLLTEAAIADRLTGKAAMIIAEDHYPDHNERTEVIRFLMKTFEHDGYLHQDGRDYVFKNSLLKDYWEKEFSFYFIPSDQRNK